LQAARCEKKARHSRPNNARADFPPHNWQKTEVEVNIPSCPETNLELHTTAGGKENQQTTTPSGSTSANKAKGGEKGRGGCLKKTVGGRGLGKKLLLGIFPEVCCYDVATDKKGFALRGSGPRSSSSATRPVNFLRGARAWSAAAPKPESGAMFIASAVFGRWMVRVPGTEARGTWPCNMQRSRTLPWVHHRYLSPPPSLTPLRPHARLSTTELVSTDFLCDGAYFRSYTPNTHQSIYDQCTFSYYEYTWRKNENSKFDMVKSIRKTAKNRYNSLLNLCIPTAVVLCS
jgi:hypothetical protein